MRVREVLEIMRRYFQICKSMKKSTKRIPGVFYPLPVVLSQSKSNNSLISYLHSIHRQFESSKLQSVLIDIIKRNPGIVRNYEVRVHIEHLGESKILSTNCTTWEDCFDEFSRRPVAAVYVVMNNGVRSKLEKPGQLGEDDIIDIEFKKET